MRTVAVLLLLSSVALAGDAPKAEVDVPQRLQELASPDVAVRQKAARTLQEWGALTYETAGAEDAIRGRLQDADGLVRIYAAKSLRDNANADVATIAAIRARLADENVDVRFAAAATLRKLAPPALDTVPVLAALLKHENASVRTKTARTLLVMEADAREAEAALEEATRDSNASVRRYAGWALQKIRTAPPAPTREEKLAALKAEIAALKEKLTGLEEELARLEGQPGDF